MFKKLKDCEKEFLINKQISKGYSQKEAEEIIRNRIKLIVISPLTAII